MRRQGRISNGEEQMRRRRQKGGAARQKEEQMERSKYGRTGTDENEEEHLYHRKEQMQIRRSI